MPVKQKTIEEKFWRHVSKTNHCWVWNGTLNDSGYGVVFHDFNGSGHKQYRAHRIAYFIYNGVMLERNEVLMHTCDNPRCVNPDHLVVGTQQDNLRDMCKKGRNRYGTSRGLANPRTKLNEDLVLQMLVMFRDGWRIQDIARHFKLHPSTVHSAICGNSWKWLR